MATVTKQQLIKQLSLQNRRPQQFYQVALREILKGIQQQLAKGNKVVFTGFGQFNVSSRKGGTARNLKTGERVSYGDYRLVHFSQGDILKRAIRKK